jgi:hypothetical protein
MVNLPVMETAVPWDLQSIAQKQQMHGMQRVLLMAERPVKNLQVFVTVAQ